MFMRVYLVQEKGWRLEGATIAVQTNPFLKQQEYNSIISPSDRIIATT